MADIPIPPQYAHMAKAACLLLLHPSSNKIAVCSRRDSHIYGLPGGKVDSGESMAQAAARETEEEIGVVISISNMEFLFADAIPGVKDFWVETFIAVSPTHELKQMEEDIAVKWTLWDDFLQKNAFKEYNASVYTAFQQWVDCHQKKVIYTPDLNHLELALPTESPSYS